VGQSFCHGHSQSPPGCGELESNGVRALGGDSRAFQQACVRLFSDSVSVQRRALLALHFDPLR